MKHNKWQHIHDINTFACEDGEVYLSGTDEKGRELKNIYKNIICQN